MKIIKNKAKFRFCHMAMRKLMIIWFFGVTSFFLFSHVASAVSLSIDGNQKYQTIDGFGTNINSLSWTNDNSKAAIDLLADQMGQTLWRVVFDMEDWESSNDNNDPNTPDWTYYNSLYSSAKFQNLWGTLRYLNQKGFNKTVALSFMGRVPGWMGSTTISPSQQDEATEMIATLIYYARNTEQVQFGMVDPFNETDWDGIEGPQLPSPQYVSLLHKLSVKLDAMGLSDIRFLGPNTANVSTGVNDFMPTMMADAVVMGKVDHFGFHNYSADSGGANTALVNSSYSGKNYWMTEFANPADAFTFLGQNASGLMVWEGFDSVYNHAILAGRGTQPGNDDVGYVPLAYNQSTHTYTPRKEFYQNAQLFKFVPPGSVRIAATGSTGGLTTFAFYHQSTGRVTIVARNTGAAASVSATLTNLPAVTSFAYYKTDASNNMAQGADVNAQAGVFSYSVPSGAVVTLTAVAGVVAPVSLNTLTVTPSNPSVLVNGTQQFTATGTYSDNSVKDLTSQVSWTSSSPTIATVNSGGLATGINTGSSTITATIGGVTGTSNLTIKPAPLSVSTTSLPDAVVGVAYSAELVASGGTKPYNWTVSGLPPELSQGVNTGVLTGTPTTAGAFAFTVQVNDSSTPAQSANKTLSIRVVENQLTATSLSIWPSTAAPVLADGGLDSAVELGVKFRSDVAGTIKAIRFYKASANTGTHIGNLWSSTGTRLATATFSNESTSGWQQVNFSTPVAIAANTVYVASYHANNGHYSSDQGYFASSGRNTPPLHTLVNGGVYAYGANSVFPAQTWNSTNYWVDVLFTPDSVSAPTLNSIAMTPSSQTILIGATQQFTAMGTYSDGSTQNLNSLVTWASSNTAVSTINTSGMAIGAGEGKSTISATLNGVTGNTVLTVQYAPLTISTLSLSGGTLGRAYSSSLVASGGVQPYTWSITAGSLPPGVNLANNTGAITGTPTTTGTFNFTVQVSDLSSSVQRAEKTFTITISNRRNRN